MRYCTGIAAARATSALEVYGADKPRGWRRDVAPALWWLWAAACTDRASQLRELHVPLCELGTGPESNRYPDMKRCCSHWHVAYYAIRLFVSADSFTTKKGITQHNLLPLVLFHLYFCAFSLPSLFLLRARTPSSISRSGLWGPKIGKWRLGLGCKVVPAMVKDWNWHMHLILIAG